MSLHIDGVEFRAAQRVDVLSGLLGWVSFRVGGDLRINSVGVRVTRQGKHTLSFPCRRDRANVEHAIVSPVSAAAHRTVEEQVLGELRRQGALR